MREKTDKTRQEELMALNRRVSALQKEIAAVKTGPHKADLVVHLAKLRRKQRALWRALQPWAERD